LKEIAVLCGIDKNITFHLARHTFATTIVLLFISMKYKKLQNILPKRVTV
jgi:integrase